MIQFNLLPDIKLEYIQANRLKRLIITIALAVAAVSVVLCLLLLVVVQSQKKHSGDLKTDIDSNVQKLQGTKDLDKILTVQGQLKALPDLHHKKPATTRLVGYLTQVTPANVYISDVTVDFTQSTMQLTGTSDTLLSVNKFIDTLKFTNLKTGTDEPKTGLAFSKVLLTSYGATDKGASYAISFTFDPVMFDNQVAAVLEVPRTITTRSEMSKPDALFQATPREENE